MGSGTAADAKPFPARDAADEPRLSPGDQIILIKSPKIQNPSSESGAVPQPEGLGDEDIAGAANDCQDLTPGFAPVM